jgi:predicted GIY-YIG superfamily endonuclease
MHYVYILRSQTHPNQTYIGSTTDLKKRLSEHNAGKSTHTNKFKPWHLHSYIALPEKPLAEKLERYLKTGSGRVFAKRHLQQQK